MCLSGCVLKGEQFKLSAPNLVCVRIMHGRPLACTDNEQEGLAVASIVRDVVVEMTPPRDDNTR